MGEGSHASAGLFGYRIVGITRVRSRHGQVFFVSGPPVSLVMHWNAELRRTMPCTRGKCRNCDEGCPRRPLSYIPVWERSLGANGSYWTRKVLEVPFRCGIDLMDRVGNAVALRRTKQCGPVDIGTPGRIELPADRGTFSVWGTLLAVWRLPSGTETTLASEEFSTMA